jgi:hypothetical protein
MSLSHLKQIPCPSCGSEQTLRVSLMLAGSDASFTMCSVCEWKGWERDGQLIQLGSVLSLVASR